MHTVAPLVLQIERSLVNISPSGDSGPTVAVEVCTVWMYNVYLTGQSADFCDDSNNYCNTATQADVDTNAAIINDDEQRVSGVLDNNNANQSKRSRDGVVRDGMFDNMRDCFKGSDSRFAQGWGRRTNHHSEFTQSEACLCVCRTFLNKRGVRIAAIEITGITVPMLLNGTQLREDNKTAAPHASLSIAPNKTRFDSNDCRRWI